MTPTKSRIRPAALAVSASAMLLAGCSASQIGAPRTDVFNLGRNAANEPCTANRAWNDPAAPDAFAASYFITCRSATASRPLGALRVVDNDAEGMKPVDAVLSCGDPKNLALAAGAAEVRQCRNSALAANTVRIDIVRGDRRIVGDATPDLLGPLEEGMAILAGSKPISADAGRETTASIVLADLPPRPADVAGTPTSGDVAYDPRAALAQGISLNHRGLHVDASRILNDALSRVGTKDSPALRAELLIEAALADSNIAFVDSATAHFTAAEAVLASSPEARTPFITRKLNAYYALDLINRRQYPDALKRLDALVSAQVAADRPLMDPTVVRRLNQVRAGEVDASSALAVPDSAELSQLVLDGQAQWARSVVLLALGRIAESERAINASDAAYRTLQGERIDKAPIRWLGARIARQRGRLAAERRQFEGAKGAIAYFEQAIDDLRRSSLAAAGTGAEPAIAEAELERASIVARSARPYEEKRAAYASAVDAMIASNMSGSALPAGIDGYFDLLVAESQGGARPDTHERFFRAMQAAGEPAVARQLNQLQNIVTADPALARKIRERAEIDREITRLRYTIATNDGTQGTLEELEQKRQEAEARRAEIGAELATNERFRAVDDSPATLAEIRAALQPGEGFLKVAELNQRVFGLYVTADETFIYQIAGTARERAALDKLAGDVRYSIDGRLMVDNKLVPFDVAKSHVLYRLVAGPAREAIGKSTALVIDPAGPLEQLPAGILVTEYDPAAKRRAFDFSKTAFLAARTTISTAVSPRSFLVARALPASSASRPFLGFGPHEAPTSVADARGVNVGFGCIVPYSELAARSRQFAPIDPRELKIAADAIGAPDAPMIMNAAFTDSAIGQQAELDQFQVLHFATHGLQEGQWGCLKSPPGLVTSFGDADSDGLLSFSEVAQLRLNANLVVLSACETASGIRSEALARGSGQEEAGQTLEGLVRAFLAANARAVLATYWKVSAEEDSEVLIRTFYESARTRSIGQSLQAAQLALMQNPDYSHPFYWAPFFVVGDSTKPMLSDPPKSQQVAAR